MPPVASADNTTSSDTTHESLSILIWLKVISLTLSSTTNSIVLVSVASFESLTTTLTS